MKPQLNANAYNHNVSVDPLAPLQDNLLVLNPIDLGPEMKAHPLLSMSLQNQVGQFSTEHVLKRMFFRRNDVNGKPAAFQGGGRLHGDEAAPDDSDTGAADDVGKDASAVL